MNWRVYIKHRGNINFSTINHYFLSEWPNDMPGAILSLTFCFSCLASGKPPSIFLSQSSLGGVDAES